MVLPPAAEPVVRNFIAAVLKRHIDERCGAVVVTDAPAALTVELALSEAIGGQRRAFRIEDRSAEGVRIVREMRRGFLWRGQILAFFPLQSRRFPIGTVARSV